MGPRSRSAGLGKTLDVEVVLLRGLAGAPVRRDGVAAAAQRSGAAERGEGGGARVRGGGCGWEEEGRLGLLFVGRRDGLGVRARDGKLAGKLGVTGTTVALWRKGMTSGSHWSAAVSARCARGRPTAGRAELGLRAKVKTAGRCWAARAGPGCGCWAEQRGGEGWAEAG